MEVEVEVEVEVVEVVVVMTELRSSDRDESRMPETPGTAQMRQICRMMMPPRRKMIPRQEMIMMMMMPSRKMSWLQRPALLSVCASVCVDARLRVDARHSRRPDLTPRRPRRLPRCCCCLKRSSSSSSCSSSCSSRVVPPCLWCC